jgi:hypothetical protein
VTKFNESAFVSFSFILFIKNKHKRRKRERKKASWDTSQVCLPNFRPFSIDEIRTDLWKLANCLHLFLQISLCVISWEEKLKKPIAASRSCGQNVFGLNSGISLSSESLRLNSLNKRFFPPTHQELKTIF